MSKQTIQKKILLIATSTWVQESLKSELRLRSYGDLKLMNLNGNKIN
jgi:hypothetical protein